MGCPDPETLAQLGTGALSGAARGALLDHAASCADCHAVVAVLAAQPTREPASGRERIDRYELRRIVGVGAMGVVYAAFDPELDREVAVKILRPHASAIRLRREAQALARLTDPNVVRVYDVGEHDGKTFIAMELIEGEHLRAWLEAPRTPGEIVRVLLQAGRGLAAAHRAGLVHRDFKPDNVLIASNGNVLVGDFGLARSAELASSDAALRAARAVESSVQLSTVTGAVVGTPAYMAPEQARGEATPASDQYAFCVTAWEACFGKRPTAPIEDRGEHSVPKRIERALRRGLSPRPEDRFVNMDALLLALQPPRSRRGLWIVTAFAASVAATAVLVLTATSSRSSAVRCEDAGALIASAWTPAREAQLGDRWGKSVTHDFARYAASWQRQRIEACVATHQRREQTVETLERQVACLDRARDALHTTVEALLRTSVALPRPAAAAQSLPSLARCEGATEAQVAPPPERTAAISALDLELAKLDVALLAGAPSVSAAATVSLRQQAEHLGFAPQIARARLLEARVAAWSGDAAAAEAVLRRTLIAADQAADDLTRAHAAALLAAVIAGGRPEEAAGLVATARAALTRAGADPAAEQVVLEGEAAVATNRGELREAVALHERIVATVRARFGEDSLVLSHEYSRLHVAWASLGDFPAAMAAQRTAIEIATRAEANAVPPDAKKVLSENLVELVTEGDFQGAAELGRRQLAVMRGLPAHSLKTEAYTTGQVAFALELDGNYREAAAAYREAEALWRRPFADFTTDGEEPDPAAIANGIAESTFARATCLLRMNRAADAVAELHRARELAISGGAATAGLLEPIARWLGQALVGAKRYREARDVLEPIADRIATNPALKPFPRAAALFALAQALWADGGTRDRERALALAGDAERYLAAAIADGEAHLHLRKLPALARAELTKIAAWRSSRPAP